VDNTPPSSGPPSPSLSASTWSSLSSNDRVYDENFSFSPHFGELDWFGLFDGILPKLWTLWEMVVLAEPILVFAMTPQDSCDAGMMPMKGSDISSNVYCLTLVLSISR
jgi:hypothetical protein